MDNKYIADAKREQLKEDNLKALIRHGIMQHLVVQNPKGIDYAVNTIYKLITTTEI